MGYMQGRIILAKMIWSFDWELLNKGQVNWLRDLRLYAIWEKPPVIVKYTSVAREKAPVGDVAQEDVDSRPREVAA